MLRWFGLLAFLAATAGEAGGEPRLLCDDASLTVEGGSAAVRQRICDVVAREVPKLASCNVRVPADLTLRIEKDLAPDCMGLFHCGKSLIQLLPPDLMSERRRPDRAFATVPDGAYFDSVIVHELTHAAYDAVPCPFTHCVATTEYVAYAMQIRSLPPGARAAFEAASEIDHDIARDELNAMYYAFAPDRFAQKAWLHFTQREDGCALIGQVMDGAVFFDQEHF
ncbi:hypothetical protein ROJ8625_01877 [Roseivivax jejudonensis]|uniref:Uncharacterized protein n=1 Tax=Roseivivax jejudonensis TaxID=1529041 RepID=A0A1X6Z435_9RHOB|nr:DUF6639 family protein [Roseivivax jejudonensis]SLN39936.1 hypothetical protein ROJ8625_01877 [Roseivivax jejudonensis]